VEKCLADLLEQVMPDNGHGEIDWGGPVGKEVW
jgi:antitoxin component of MazEF toxin-antitoxin module